MAEVTEITWECAYLGIRYTVHSRASWKNSCGTFSMSKGASGRSLLAGIHAIFSTHPRNHGRLV